MIHLPEYVSTRGAIPSDCKHEACHKFHIQMTVELTGAALHFTPWNSIITLVMLSSALMYLEPTRKVYICAHISCTNRFWRTVRPTTLCWLFVVFQLVYNILHVWRRMAELSLPKRHKQYTDSQRVGHCALSSVLFRDGYLIYFYKCTQVMSCEIVVLFDRLTFLDAIAFAANAALVFLERWTHARRKR